MASRLVTSATKDIGEVRLTTDLVVVGIFGMDGTSVLDA